MSVILKYKLLERGNVTPAGVDVVMPADAKILSVQEQNGEVMVWAEVNTARARELHKSRRFYIMWTGDGYDEDVAGKYITTLVLKDASPGIVLHIFDAGEVR